MTEWSLGSDGIYRGDALCSTMYVLQALREYQAEVERLRETENDLFGRIKALEEQAEAEVALLREALEEYREGWQRLHGAALDYRDSDSLEWVCDCMVCNMAREELPAREALDGEA